MTLIHLQAAVERGTWPTTQSTNEQPEVRCVYVSAVAVTLLAISNRFIFFILLLASLRYTATFLKLDSCRLRYRRFKLINSSN